MKTPLFIVCCMVLVCQSAYAQKDLLAAEKNRFEVMVKKDTKSLTDLLSDDLIYTHSSGKVDGKEAILKSVEAGTYQQIEILEQNPVSWGSTGVISGKARMVIHDANGDRTIVLRYTDVYRRQGNTWQLVAWQSLLADN